MNKLPIIFGYAGTLPFILFMLLSFVANEESTAKAITTLQMAYGAMILSFLGGIHWGQAIPSNNTKQLSFSMLLTIGSFGLMILGFFTPSLPLLLMACLFWAVYYADRNLMPLDYIPEGYFSFRRNLTIIVSGTLLISFFAVL